MHIINLGLSHSLPYFRNRVHHFKNSNELTQIANRSISLGKSNRGGLTPHDLRTMVGVVATLSLGSLIFRVLDCITKLACSHMKRNKDTAEMPDQTK